MRVVFPAPLWPSIAVIWSSYIVNDKPVIYENEKRHIACQRQNQKMDFFPHTPISTDSKTKEMLICGNEGDP